MKIISKAFPFETAERLEAILQWSVITVICITGFFYNYDPVSTYLKLHFFPDGTTDQGVFITYLSILISCLLVIIYRLGSKSDKVLQTIEKSNFDFDKKLYTKGTMEIYNDVDAEIKSRFIIDQNSHISILGYTLFSVAPKLDHWKEMGKLKNITLDLYHLKSDFIHNNTEVEGTWETQLKSFLDYINQFKNDNAVLLKRNKVKINLIPYSHIPAVHGFKLGNGSIYFSIASWNPSNLKLAQPNFNSTYIKIEANDRSKHAVEFRQLFNNWILKSRGQN